MKNLKRLSLLLLITSLLYSCTCEKRLDKVLAKCPELLQHDTIKIRDTIVINGVQRDTVFNYLVKDTVIIREGGLTMKYFYKTHDSTVYLSGKCDTIYIPYSKDLPVSQVLNENSSTDWWVYVAIGFLAVVIILLLYRK